MHSELVCITCPIGCRLQIEMENNEILSVTGNTCPRGIVYAKQEMIDPQRVLTSTVRVSNSNAILCSVKSDRALPKNKLFDCMDAINRICIKAPVHIGDIIIENILDTGVNIVATMNIESK